MKILVVLPRFPYPLEKGDKLRAYHQIVELAKTNEIHLFAVSHTKVTPEQRQALQPYCASIDVVHPTKFTAWFNTLRNGLRAKSLQMGYWDSARARKAVRNLVRTLQPDVVYNQMIRTVPLVARLNVTKVMDFQDALSLNTERRMEHSRGLMRSVLHYEFKMLRSTEYNAFRIFDALTIIASADADAIPHQRSGEIHIIPNGVDLDYFTPDVVEAKDNDVVFCGNLQYKPNIDAAQFLVREVMPVVWRQRPDTHLIIAGATPKSAVRQLASPNVEVVGSVPDIRLYYRRSRVFIAPMRIGSGLQNKILEAMATGVPCVTTPIANLAIGATPGTQLLIGEKPDELASHIISLLSDSNFAHSLAGNASQFVRTRFSWPAAVQPLQQIFDGLLESK